VNGQGYLDHPITANRLVKRESDFTEITYTFAAEPDWTKPGTQSVDVVLTDAAGNAATITSTLTLAADTEAPEIFGTKDRYCYIGKPVAYFDGVFAEDNCDETDAITLDVDKSQVNMYEAGTYTVTYTATDTSGNSVSRSCKFKFVEETVTEDQINELADEVLSEIITDDMSMGKKAYAIYEYVFDRIRYTNSSDKTNWQAEAYRGLTEGRGDCFTYFSTAKCLLQRAGIPTMDVERHGGNRPTRHYWLLVNVGTGWYHFDAINVAPGKVKCFMKTNAEVWAWDPNFWSFDTSLYDVATEKFVLQ
jgi:transglutaminase-like putative cysteine protease